MPPRQIHHRPKNPIPEKSLARFNTTKVEINLWVTFALFYILLLQA